VSGEVGTPADLACVDPKLDLPSLVDERSAIVEAEKLCKLRELGARVRVEA
jgi:hypothetical protein